MTTKETMERFIKEVSEKIRKKEDTYIAEIATFNFVKQLLEKEDVDKNYEREITLKKYGAGFGWYRHRMDAGELVIEKLLNNIQESVGTKISSYKSIYSDAYVSLGTMEVLNKKWNKNKDVNIFKEFDIEL